MKYFRVTDRFNDRSERVSKEVIAYAYEFQTLAIDYFRTEKVPRLKNPYEHFTLGTMYKSLHLYKVPHSYDSSIVFSDECMDFLSNFRLSGHVIYPINYIFRKKLKTDMNFHFFNDTVINKLNLEKTLWRIRNSKTNPFGKEIQRLYQVESFEENEKSIEEYVRFRNVESLKIFIKFVNKDIGKYSRAIDFIEVSFNDSSIYEMDFINYGIGTMGFYISERLEKAMIESGFDNFKTFDPSFKFV